MKKRKKHKLQSSTVTAQQSYNIGHLLNVVVRSTCRCRQLASS